MPTRSGATAERRRFEAEEGRSRQSNGQSHKCKHSGVGMESRWHPCQGLYALAVQSGADAGAAPRRMPIHVAGIIWHV
eukprot:2471074-Rhodomonas_salina.1